MFSSEVAKSQLYGLETSTHISPAGEFYLLSLTLSHQSHNFSLPFSISRASMAFLHSLTSPSPNSTLSYSNIHQFQNPSSSFPVSLSVSSPNNTRHLRLLITSALNPQTGQPTKKASTGGSGSNSTNKKRQKKGKSANPPIKEDWELRDAADALAALDEEDDDGSDYSSSSSSSRSLATFNSPPTIPKPPAGFVIDETGRVLMASKKRIATVVSQFFLQLHFGLWT